MIPTKELVKSIFNFCEALGETKFFPYQEKLSKRIIRSLLDNDGAILTALQARQSGKSYTVAKTVAGCAVIMPILANMPMFENDPRLEKYKDGFLIGCFAPALHQSQIIFNKIKDTLGSERAAEIFDDPEINVVFDTNNGQNIVLRFQNLSIKSTITCMSASEQSNIEGKSYMLVIVDEAQDVGNMKFSKSVLPMLAFFNGTTMLIGTATITRGFFYNIHEQNKLEYKNGESKKNFFEFDYRYIIKYNPNYNKHIEMMKKKIGEESDEFQMSYCVSPETKILTSKLTWVRADSIRRGDKLIGFDENPPNRYNQRKFKESIVEDVGSIKRPCYRLTFEDGTVITCSSEHQWLTFTAGSRTEWTKTEDLCYTDRVYKMCDTWKMPYTDYKLGYLSAAFDGEGNISQHTGKIGQICFAQKENAMYRRVKKYLKYYGFTYSDRVDKRSNVHKIYLTGGKYEFLRLMGTVRPCRLLKGFNANKLGTVRCCNYKDRGFYHPHLVKKEFVGMQTVIPIRTTTGTYIAEGLASHNCLRWILERGMFVEPDKFERLGDTTLGLVDGDTVGLYVAGIDLGKTNDSTVVTVIKPDWDNPVVIEKSDDAETEDYVVYEGVVVGWKELQGDDWNVQYDKILDYLDLWRLERVLIDATGVGSPMYDRLAPALSQRSVEAIPYVYSTQSKSVLFKHLDSQIKECRITYPADEDTQETLEYQHFTEQMLSAEKTYNGQNLVVAAPKTRNAHDDYCTSLAMAVFAMKGEATQKVTEEENMFIQVSQSTVNYYRSRNRITGGRRRY